MSCAMCNVPVPTEPCLVSTHSLHVSPAHPRHASFASLRINPLTSTPLPTLHTLHTRQDQPADLNTAADVLRSIERAYFGIERPTDPPIPQGALILSFEIYRDSYARRHLSRFDYYISAHDARCSAVAVSQARGRP